MLANQTFATLRRPPYVFEPLREASLDLPFLAGAWLGLALAPFALSAAWAGAGWAVMDATTRTFDG